MEEKRRDSIGTPPPPSAGADGATPEQPTTRRSRGGQKRKSTSINSVGSGSNPQTTSSKRQAREKPPPVPFPSIHMNGPCTRARVQPYNWNSFSEVVAVKSEAEVREAAAKAEEMIRANENWQALGAKIEADYEAIRSRDASVHVVPFHAGWFSWTKVHPMEEKMLPSFFNGKSESRTSEIYMEIRNWIMKKFHFNPNEQIETKHLSEIKVGDSDAQQEVMEFLDYWGLINYHPFPLQESSAIAVDNDADKDENGKNVSLVENLFKFETVESWTPVVPRMNTTMPSASSGLLPESVVADELVRSEEPRVEYHCNSCSADCSRKRYHCQKQADFDLCADCFNNGKFGSDMSPSDFILMEPGEVGGASGGNWTDQETLLLLEAIELFRDNWSEIAEHVATKTKAQCILHFVQMPIVDAFYNHDDEVNDPPKDNEAPVATTTENSAMETDQDGNAIPQEVLPKTESQEGATDNQDPSCPTDTSKPDEINVLDKNSEGGESFVLKALQEAFEAVGSLPAPGEKLSFAEAGNPVMAMAAFLVRLVDPTVVTASVHNLLKSLSSHSSSEHLAARHCFPLEDPPDDKKNQTNVEGALTETIEHEAHKNKNNQAKNKEGTPESVVNENSSQDETEASKDSLSQEHEKMDSASEGQKSVSDKSDTVKEPDEMVASDKAQPVSAREPSSTKSRKDRENLTVSVHHAEAESKLVKESEDKASAGDASQPKEHKKDEKMTSEADLSASSSINGKETNTGEKSETDSAKEELNIDKLKKAAVTALSAAAVKAKFLADQEEEEILKLTTMLIEKQVYKLETKMAFFHDMENVMMRVKEQLDRSKQKLFHERAQIIATRFGMSASARPNMPGAPSNRAAPNVPNPTPRPPFMGMNSLRPPFPRPPNPNPSSAATFAAAASNNTAPGSAQPNTAGMK
ncbi:SWI/SNF complex subunit SWI3D [Andrographis paniculata]|uniref:SWI/SNF complex subunit SWI3D n=1 Tax=Andrographis paniculata TaxID=175694 RepID=UPI0021E7CEA2|nr:SWI/SNF complex subunit SWI3D [Andrographis paniculata]